MSNTTIKVSFKASVTVCNQSQAIELIEKLKTLGLVFEGNVAYIAEKRGGVYSTKVVDIVTNG